MYSEANENLSGLNPIYLQIFQLHSLKNNQMQLRISFYIVWLVKFEGVIHMYSWVLFWKYLCAWWWTVILQDSWTGEVTSL